MMRNIRARVLLLSLVHTFPSTLAVLGLFTACVSAPDYPAPDHPEWIRIGVTTKDEVIQRYGHPDMVIASPGGDTAIYRPTASGQSAPRVEIPTAQAGPLGSATTRMQPIDPGLGAKALNGKTKERLRKEMRIRYDSRGVVQELSSP
ncbi:MAG: hypothetical protein WCH20_05050 [Nitrospira sp.]